MSKPFTIDDIHKLAQSGKIKGYEIKGKRGITPIISTVTDLPKEEKRAITPKKQKDKSGSEDQLQRNCVSWFCIEYPHLYRAKRLHHCPNGGTRNAAEAGKLKGIGVIPGVSDLLLTIPRGRYGGAFFELKVGKNDLSDHQKAFIEEHKEDYYCCVIRSVEEFRHEVKMYLNLKTTLAGE